MTKKEIIKCDLFVKIKDVDGKIIKLEKKNVPFEVSFEKGASSGKGKEIVVFEKFGKEYKLVVELENVGKRWFDYYIVSAERRPADGEKFITWRADEGDIIGKSAWNIYCTTRRSFGWWIIGGSALFLLLVGVIAIYFWKKKQ